MGIISPMQNPASKNILLTTFSINLLAAIIPMPSAVKGRLQNVTTGTTGPPAVQLRDIERNTTMSC